MKTIPSWRRYPYLARVGTFLITLTLIAGMVGCVQPAYILTIASTTGGHVTTPGEGTFTYYAEGVIVLVVALVAEADEGYHFVNWTGNAGTIGNVSAASTNITVNGDYSITANFVAVYDLTISSTAGGNVTAPGEGTFPYDAGTVVDLVAEAEEGYRFGEWTGDVDTIGNVTAAATTITMQGDYEITANFEAKFMVAAVWCNTVGLKTDGTVVAVGDTSRGQCNVGNWTDIVQVAAGDFHTVGLESNGTVVAVGLNTSGQCNVDGWENITQVAAGGSHTVGLCSNGTVVAVGDNTYGQCNVGNWTGIIQVAAGSSHTVGLESDGTVVAVGYSNDGRCDVGNWTGIIQVAAGSSHTVGLESDGTVVAVGQNGSGRCDVSNWGNIIQVAAGTSHTVGVKANGTVVAVGSNNSGQCNVGGWSGIIQVAAGYFHTVGLESGGTVVAVGSNGYGQCGVGGWDLRI